MQAQLEQVKQRIEADLGRLALDRDLSGNTPHERHETPCSAVRWLRKKLLPGCRLKKTLVPEAASDSISLKELAAAKDALSVKVEPCGYGADVDKKKKKIPDMVFWSLPE